MFRNFFRGRYGIDNLSLALLVGASLFVNFRYTSLIAYIMLAWSIYRMFSRDVNKRYRELQKFNLMFRAFKPFFDRLMMGISGFFRSIRKKYNVLKIRYQERKDFVFIKCPKCGNTLRLPRKKGKLQVTCPVCREEFFKRT